MKLALTSAGQTASLRAAIRHQPQTAATAARVLVNAFLVDAPISDIAVLGVTPSKVYRRERTHTITSARCFSFGRPAKVMAVPGTSARGSLSHLSSSSKVQVPLPFAFPFGGQSYTQAWMTNTLGVYFSNPGAPNANQIVEGFDLYDRTPRVAPLLVEPARPWKNSTPFLLAPKIRSLPALAIDALSRSA